MFAVVLVFRIFERLSTPLVVSNTSYGFRGHEKAQERRRIQLQFGVGDATELCSFLHKGGLKCRCLGKKKKKVMLTSLKGRTLRPTGGS